MAQPPLPEIKRPPRLWFCLFCCLGFCLCVAWVLPVGCLHMVTGPKMAGVGPKVAGVACWHGSVSDGAP